MKNQLKTTAHNFLVVLALLGVYCFCESVWFTWMYAIIPVAIVTAAVAFISFIVGMIIKKTWLVVVLPSTTLVSIAALAVVTRLLNGLPL